jgi:hypothetical protein
MSTSKIEFWPVSSPCAKEAHSLRHGSISGGSRLSVKMFLLRSNSYAEAKSWGDLVHAFTESLKNSPLDEFILLQHTSIPGPQGRRWKFARPVSYNRLDEIPKLLLMAPSALKIGTTTAHQQRPQVEVATGVQPDDDYDGQVQQERINIPQEKIADGKEAEVIMSGGDHEQEIDETRINAAKMIQETYRRHLEQKRAGAARKIQAAYHRHVKRKGVVRRGIDGTQARYWLLLRKRSLEMEWSKGSRYNLLFRVPLAYILVCLEVIGAFIESEKKEVKKRIKTEDDKDLEELMETLTQHRYDSVDCTLYEGSNRSSSKLLKKTIALQKKLSPSSKFHEGRSVNDLQRVLLEVKDIVESLDNIPGSVGTRKQIKKRWDRGWAWIFEKQERRVKGKKAERPKLELDREDLLYL